MGIRVLCWACRKGAAFGLAGVVKGLGISAVNGYGILATLKTALDDKALASLICRIHFTCLIDAMIVLPAGSQQSYQNPMVPQRLRVSEAP